MSEKTPIIQSEGPEFEVMCRAARVRFDAVQADRISALVDEGLDWRVFLSNLERHYVAPLVYRNLASIPALKIPPKVLETMRVRSLITAWKSLQFATELARLSRRLEANSIQVIHYKGAVAAQQYYSALTLRNFHDLDFLVRRADLVALIKVLESEGYHNSEDFTPAQFAHFVTEFKEFMFNKAEFAIEPHWSIAGRRYPFETDYEGFWHRARMLSVEGEALRVLGAEDALLVLCLVGAKGRWQRLQMVCDVAECLRSSPDLDWSTVQAMARATGTVLILQLGLRLAAELAGTELPATAHRDILKSSAVDRLARDVVMSMTRSHGARRFLPDSPSVFSPLLFRQRERIQDRWSYLWRTITTPSVAHLERIPLPKVLFPLYRVIVPLHDYVAFPAISFIRSLARYATIR